jgi:hypothetical protein
MMWYHYLTFIALLICLIGLSFHLIRLVRLGAPVDYSRRRGDVTPAIAYSFVGAMSPTKKESAYLHLPTYAAGLLYHIGTFTSVILLFVYLLEIEVGGIVRWALMGLLTLSTLSGMTILVKRMAVKPLKSLSNPDDYISNFLVTVFQLFTVARLGGAAFAPFYFLSASLLLLYVPIGKLKHALYFFAARYHLGLFYGWRGIWPLRRS